MSASGPRPPGVQWNPPSGALRPSPGTPAHSDRVVAGLVLALLVACGTLALYDTLLLLAGLASG